MNRRWSLLAFGLPLIAAAWVFARQEEPAAANPRVLLKTSAGEITIELFADKAPQTVENFLTYVEDKHFDGTLFHRVIPDFMIQGGGMTEDFEEKEPRDPVKNEADNGLKNERGTIAMARTPKVDSATSQFFINVNDNPDLDHKDKTARGFGYCVFGKVVEGMDVVDEIKDVPTTSRGPHKNVPKENVLIEEARRIEEQPKP